jgi:uncharacterized membrane protein
MAFCPNCGSNVEGKFCAKCGATVAAPGGPAPSGPGAYQTGPGAPPQAPYSTGPAAPQPPAYNAPPAYGPGPGAAPPQYPPAYGAGPAAPQPPYGTPPAYGPGPGQPPAYGAPPAAPQQPYGAPPPAYQAPPSYQAPQQGYQAPPSYQSGQVPPPYQQGPQQPYGGGGYPPQPAPAGAMQENVASLLCYLVGWITGLVFLLLEPYKHNRNIKFHAWQSIILFGAVSIIQILISVVFWNILVGSGGGSYTMYEIYIWGTRIFYLAVLAAWIFLMVQAYNNKRFVLPIIGAIAEKQANS